eukprot:CAMPEP_0178964574 /NCGR_PEP_ID=MMETSP0789-20121207/15757_1 /TAXON_ID=3005 /ORGANISM="Rhizosolenia setigera, Strain CCMP 1694" /LENGTH=249 /DNA_ID=CAMNT_0020649373 /DNA_START=35 /DNA_END=784 /DNA_ORIENTATION=-
MKCLSVSTSGFYLLFHALVSRVDSFVVPSPSVHTTTTTTRSFIVSSSSLLSSTSSSDDDASSSSSGLADYLASKYPSFYSLLKKSDEISKLIEKKSSTELTLFAPTEEAFEKLGSKKLSQLNDPRNLETAEKIAQYHIIKDALVTSRQLKTEDWKVKRKPGEPAPLTIDGIQTMGGKVRVGRSKSGGILGGLLFAKEDGYIAVGSADAKILKTETAFTEEEGVIVHEVDKFISPDVLWRYADQLRIPGF